MVTSVPAISHRFDQDGDYEVSVTMTLGDRQGQSEPLHITVHSTEYNLAVSWEPLQEALRFSILATITESEVNSQQRSRDAVKFQL